MKNYTSYHMVDQKHLIAELRAAEQKAQFRAFVGALVICIGFALIVTFQ